MKSIIPLLLILIAFGVGYFFFGKTKYVLPRIIVPTSVTGGVSVMQSGGMFVTDGTGEVMEEKLTNDKIYDIFHAYIHEGDNAIVAENMGRPGMFELKRLIDNVITSYPTQKSYVDYFSIKLADRRSTLEKSLTTLDKKSMAFASISDVINGTTLCDGFDQKVQCIEQRNLLIESLKSEMIDKSYVTLEKDKFVSVYAFQNNFTQEQYIDFIDSLLKKYLQISQ